MLYDQFGFKVGYASATWLAGQTMRFLDTGSNIRVKYGILQVYNETDGKWYPLKCRSIEGIPNLYLGDIGETS